MEGYPDFDPSDFPDVPPEELELSTLPLMRPQLAQDRGETMEDQAHALLDLEQE